jgi:hypothetical protein
MGEGASFWPLFWFGYVAMCLVFAWVGFLVGRSKGRARLGGWLGLLLGPFGVLAVGLMEPTRDVLEQRVLGTVGDAAGGDASRDGHVGAGFAISPQVRQELLAEAIRRDPALATVSDPAGFKRLAESVAALEEEFRLKHELEQLRSTQQAAAERERGAAVAAQQQADLDAARGRRLEAVRAAELLAAERERERLSAMNPFSRWIVTHRVPSIVAAGLAVVALAAAVVHLAGPAATANVVAVAATAPQLEGRSLDEARALADALHLTIETDEDTREVMRAFPDGWTIASQRPEPGTEVKAGDTITVELDGAVVDVPSTVGMTAEQARRTLLASGFRPVFVDDYGHKREFFRTKWPVRGSAPESGTQAAQGRKVSLQTGDDHECRLKCGELVTQD